MPGPNHDFRILRRFSRFDGPVNGQKLTVAAQLSSDDRALSRQIARAGHSRPAALGAGRGGGA
jgi:hypothetical protein